MEHNPTFIESQGGIGELAPHQILIKPLVTEKGTEQAEKNNVYAFQINAQANKFDVRRAVEAMFHVEVVSVAIQNRKGKPRRIRARIGTTAPWKKAIVKLGPDHKIEFF